MWLGVFNWSHVAKVMLIHEENVSSENCWASNRRQPGLFPIPVAFTSWDTWSHKISEPNFFQNQVSVWVSCWDCHRGHEKDQLTALCLLGGECHWVRLLWNRFNENQDSINSRVQFQLFLFFDEIVVEETVAMTDQFRSSIMVVKEGKSQNLDGWRWLSWPTSLFPSMVKSLISHFRVGVMHCHSGRHVSRADILSVEHASFVVTATDIWLQWSKDNFICHNCHWSPWHEHQHGTVSLSAQKSRQTTTSDWLEANSQTCWKQILRIEMIGKQSLFVGLHSAFNTHICQLGKHCTSQHVWQLHVLCQIFLHWSTCWCGGFSTVHVHGIGVCGCTHDHWSCTDMVGSNTTKIDTVWIFSLRSC